MPRNVLFIDDDEGLRTLVARDLRRDGVAVATAGDGETGLKLLGEQDFDVVAVDLDMPGLSGLDTLERINQIPNHPPVVMVTGMQDGRTAVAALKAGAFDYVIKDVHGDFLFLLKAAMRTAVEAMRLRRAKEIAEAEVREARDRFEALAAERALLMREVNHRVGNSLQLIASLLTLQGNAARDADVKQALVSATGRVLAVAQVHRRLYTSDDVQSVSLDQYLAALLEDLRRSASTIALSQIKLTADPLNLEPDRAVAVGVIVNELVTNALKYAYPEGRGEIRVRLQNTGQHGLLHVEDDGVGFSPAIAAKARSGLGQRIVKAMGEKLNAKIVYEAAKPGTRVVVSFDLMKVPTPHTPAAA